MRAGGQSCPARAQAFVLSQCARIKAADAAMDTVTSSTSEPCNRLATPINATPISRGHTTLMLRWNSAPNPTALTPTATAVKRNGVSQFCQPKNGSATNKTGVNAQCTAHNADTSNPLMSMTRINVGESAVVVAERVMTTSSCGGL